MQRIIVFAITLAVVGGLVGAFAYSQLSDRASAVPAPWSVSIASPLDGVGNVKVAQQGTTSVNVTNASLPVSGTVNVGNLPTDAQGNVRVSGIVTPPTGRLMLVGQNISLAAGGSFTSNYVDTSDCHSLVLFTDAVGQIGASLHVSADGINPYGGFDPTGASGEGGRAARYFTLTNSALLVTPSAAALINEVSATQPATITKVWLFCSQ